MLSVSRPDMRARPAPPPAASASAAAPVPLFIVPNGPWRLCVPQLFTCVAALVADGHSTISTDISDPLSIEAAMTYPGQPARDLTGGPR
jgi:hypothetical protein